MGHLSIRLTTLLLAFFTFNSQTLSFEAQAITTKKVESSVNVNSLISYPLEVADEEDHRGSGR